MFVQCSLLVLGSHTAICRGRGELGLLNGGSVKDRTSLEHPQGRGASVGNAGPQFAVADLLDLDVEGSSPLAKVDGGAVGEGRKAGDDGGGLHCE